MDRSQLEKYAKLVLKVGVNVQEGQEVLLRAPLEAKELAEVMVEVAYRDLKSGKVHVEWIHEKMTRLAIDYAPDEALFDFPDFAIDRLQAMLDRKVALVRIVAANPTLFKGVDAERHGKYIKEASKKTKFFSDVVMRNGLRWNIAAMPSPTWAEAVFPELSEEDGIAKMWEYIFKATRADLDDPIKAWEDHIQMLLDKQNFLNEKNFTKLHYKAPGTDLMVEMPEGHRWVSGQGYGEDGVMFTANIPTEEVFSMPHRLGVNGRLSSTLPLNLRGTLVKDFWFEFKDGKVIDYDAKEGKDQLTQLLETDENSKHLGEIAIVPDDSPISNLNTIFMNTLFDENASCHFALGKAYPECIENGSNLSEDELLAKGANVSLSHTDFMVGSAELDIDGYDKNGNITPIFRKGNWVI